MACYKISPSLVMYERTFVIGNKSTQFTLRLTRWPTSSGNLDQKLSSAFLNERLLVVDAGTTSSRYAPSGIIYTVVFDAVICGVRAFYTCLYAVATVPTPCLRHWRGAFFPVGRMSLAFSCVQSHGYRLCHHMERVHAFTPQSIIFPDRARDSPGLPPYNYCVTIFYK